MRAKQRICTAGQTPQPGLPSACGMCPEGIPHCCVPHIKMHTPATLLTDTRPAARLPACRVACCAGRGPPRWDRPGGVDVWRQDRPAAGVLHLHKPHHHVPGVPATRPLAPSAAAPVAQLRPAAAAGGRFPRVCAHAQGQPGGAAVPDGAGRVQQELQLPDTDRSQHEGGRQRQHARNNSSSSCCRNSSRRRPQPQPRREQMLRTAALPGRRSGSRSNSSNSSRLFKRHQEVGDSPSSSGASVQQSHGPAVAHPKPCFCDGAGADAEHADAQADSRARGVFVSLRPSPCPLDGGSARAADTAAAAGAAAGPCSSDRQPWLQRCRKRRRRAFQHARDASSSSSGGWGHSR